MLKRWTGPLEGFRPETDSCLDGADHIYPKTRYRRRAVWALGKRVDEDFRRRLDQRLSGSPRWGFASSTSLKRVINGSAGARRAARFKDRADKTWVL